MIALGCYGVLGAIKLYKEKRNKRDSDIENDPLINSHLTTNNLPSTSNSSPNGSISITSTHSSSRQDLIQQMSTSEISIRPIPPTLTVKDISSHHHDHFNEEYFINCPLIDMHDPYTQRIVSFSIGLLHGVAGPGGILGVLPAVEMQNVRSSCLYLGSFIFTSTISMVTH